MSSKGKVSYMRSCGNDIEQAKRKNDHGLNGSEGGKSATMKKSG